MIAYRAARTGPVPQPDPEHRASRARYSQEQQGVDLHRQAAFGLRWFREDRDVPALARDHGISRATGYRYLGEVIEVLAAQAPDLHEALQRAKDDGATRVILDGKLFATDRLGETTTSVKGEQIDAWYSDKHRESVKNGSHRVG